MHKSDYDSPGAKGYSREDPSDPRNKTADVSDKEYKSFQDARARSGHLASSSHLCCHWHCGIRAQFVELCEVT